MRRRYTTEKFAERIEAVRRLMPDAFIGIDVIVGFPGETESDFRTTYEFLERLAPAYLHIFPSQASRHAGRRFSGQSAAFGGYTARGGAGRALPPTARRILRPGRRYDGRGVVREHDAGRDDVRLYGQLPPGQGPYDRSRINTICRVRLGRMDDANDLEGEIVDN